MDEKWIRWIRLASYAVLVLAIIWVIYWGNFFLRISPEVRKQLALEASFYGGGPSLYDQALMFSEIGTVGLLLLAVLLIVASILLERGAEKKTG